MILLWMYDVCMDVILSMDVCGAYGTQYQSQ